VNHHAHFDLAQDEWLEPLVCMQGRKRVGERAQAPLASVASTQMFSTNICSSFQVEIPQSILCTAEALDNVQEVEVLRLAEPLFSIKSLEGTEVGLALEALTAESLAMEEMLGPLSHAASRPGSPLRLASPLSTLSSPLPLSLRTFRESYELNLSTPLVVMS
jgi:hypothetical protein